MIGRASHFAIACALSALLSACSLKSITPDSTSTESLPPPETFKVLTYNTLHGLLVERFWVRPGEMLEQQLARFNVRVDQLTDAQPDLALLQEVNPLPHMAERYVEALKARGLNYSQVHQVDACGLRLPGAALLRNLNNGLVILAKAPLRVQKLDGLKLSGTGSCHDQVGWQLGELRYALIAEVISPATHAKYLVSTAHLHSGIERDMYFLHELKDAHRQGRLMHSDHLMDALRADQELRLRELHVWLNALHRYRDEGPYAGLIIGGDFNFEPGSPEYQELERLGFKDTEEPAMSEHTLYSYNPETNPLAGHEEEQLPRELTDAIADEPAEERQAIISRYRQSIHMPRRIDFLFGMSFMPGACVKQVLFGEARATGLAGSDHYGILNTYSYHHMPC